VTTPPDLSGFSTDEICAALDDVRHPFEVAVYSSENYHNMGSIIRTCHSHLCAKIWQVDFDKFYGKATMGTHKFEHIVSVSLAEFLKQTTERNVVVFERNPELKMEDLRYYRYPENPILFFGSEKFGVPDRVIETACSVVTIPMWGLHNDINLAVAAGIATYDFVLKTTRGKYFLTLMATVSCVKIKVLNENSDYGEDS